MSCGTTPIIWRTAYTSRRILRPKTNASPEVGRSRVAAMEIVEVFPAPLGPSKPNTSPCRISKLRPATASMCS